MKDSRILLKNIYLRYKTKKNKNDLFLFNYMFSYCSSSFLCSAYIYL